MLQPCESQVPAFLKKLRLLIPLFALLLVLLPRPAAAAQVEVPLIPAEPLLSREAALPVPSAQEEEAEPAAEPEAPLDMIIDLPYREADIAGLERGLLTELAGKTWYLILDGELLVTAPEAKDLTALVVSAAEPYLTENTVDCHLADLTQLELCYGYVDFGSPADLEAAGKVLAERLVFSTTDQFVDVISIPAGEIRINDPTRYEDEEEEVYEGQDGLSQISTERVCLNGVCQSEELLSSSVLVEMRDTVIYVPSKLRPEYIWPAEGRISSHFGPRNLHIGSRNHKGLDIAAYLGSDVVASRAGTVIVSGREGGYGKVVKLDHGDGVVTVYAHNSSLCVEVGDWVEQGDVVAKAGNTGVSSGTHCHFEIRIDGVAVDPELYLIPEDGR